MVYMVALTIVGGARQEMYTFKDNSGKSVTLRPEGTAGIVRALVSNNLLYSLPQKLSYNGSMFR